MSQKCLLSYIDQLILFGLSEKSIFIRKLLSPSANSGIVPAYFVISLCIANYSTDTIAVLVTLNF